MSEAVPLQGITAREAAIRLANAAGVPQQTVRVAVAEHKSRLIFVFGPATKEERAIPYRGPETVANLLRAQGVLTDDARFDDVHVIRPHVAAGARPEVFSIDLESILLKGDESSNVILQPFDQIYVGPTRRSVLAHYLPAADWLGLDK